MLDELRFVLAATAKSGKFPGLDHLTIQNGTVKSYNGGIGMCCPIPLDIACRPHAAKLVKALEACKTTPQLSLTTKGRLSVKTAGFKAFVDCFPRDIPGVSPSGKLIEIDGAKLIGALRQVQPFIASEDSQVWANGAFIKDQSVFATNNKILIEAWTGPLLPVPMNIPGESVKEILRIKDVPVRAQYDQGSLTLHYGDRKWIRTQLLTTDWPDLGRVLDKPSNPQPIDLTLFDSLKTIDPFCDEIRKIIFSKEKISTHNVDGEGATIEATCFDRGAYNIDAVESLCNVAKTIDWSLYPSPVLWFGDGVRGAIIGMRS